MGEIAQPWIDPDRAAPSHVLSLRFTIESDVAVALRLALEDAGQVAIALDGVPVPSDVTGWFVDEAIAVVPLPAFTAGRHELILRIPYGRLTNVEWCYLLGDFGVTVRGRHARITAPVRDLAFGDWTTQGLPFYAGNVTYHCRLDGAGEPMAVHLPAFNNGWRRYCFLRAGHGAR